MNLITDPWIKVTRRSGLLDTIAPWQITSGFDKDPVVRISWPRPDFNAAIHQLLIGILQTIASPSYSQSRKIPWLQSVLPCPNWEDWLITPPPPEELLTRMNTISDAFKFGTTDEPNFLIDSQLEVSKDLKPISSLLIEAPGENTVKNNTDHFIKRDFVSSICFACCATGLYTLQSSAPSGGQGHRTSPRGGGPLTTLAIIDPLGADLEESLWINVWLNVIPLEMLEALPGGTCSNNDMGLIFPWLGEPNTSEQDKTLSAGQGHALQIYWPTPRRIKIDFSNLEKGVCSICSTNSELVSSYCTKNYGTKYGDGWHHPLSPYRENKDKQMYPTTASLAATRYRYWLDFSGNNAALVIKRFHSIKPQQVQLRLWATGYDMDNMKPLGWVDATIPQYFLSTEHRQEFEVIVQRLIDTATEVSNTIRKAIKLSWLSEGDIPQIHQIFFELTENNFYQHLNNVKHNIEKGEEHEADLTNWLKFLERTSQNIYNQFVTSGGLQFTNPQRTAEGHKEIMKLFRGKKLKDILCLSLAD